MSENHSNAIGQLALKRFKKNKVGMISLGYILICGFVACFCYLLAPDNSSNANNMHLEIHSKKPGFKTLVFQKPIAQNTSQSFIDFFTSGKKLNFIEIPISKYEVTDKDVILHLYSDSQTISKTETYALNEFDQPIDSYVKEKKFILGTDRYGRDLLSRILIGARISFFIGFIAVFISLVIGITVGAIGGYYGGKVDNFIMWIINITWSIPTLLLVIAITLALGKGFWQVFIAVGLTMWVEVARVVRGQVLSVKKQQYIEAAKVLGFSDFRIITRHILPNIMAPIIVISAANFAGAILIESGLSFLGIGAQPPTPSWGGIIKDHYSYIIVGKAYLAVIPGVAIMSLVLAFMLIGNSLRDALDVKV